GARVRLQDRGLLLDRELGQRAGGGGISRRLRGVHLHARGLGRRENRGHADLRRTADQVPGELRPCQPAVLGNGAAFPWGIVNVNLRPYYAEGSKTVGYEIAEQLGWRLPAAVVCPMAGGSLIGKVAQAFQE